MEDEITYAEVKFNKNGSAVVNTQPEKTNRKDSQKFKEANKKALRSRAMLFFMVFVSIALLAIIVTLAVLHTQLSKQPGPLSYEFLSLNSSVYGKFKDTEDKIFILANNQTNLQIELKQAENNITDLFHSKEELQVQIFKKINETIQRQFEKEENRIEQKFDDIERKLNQLTSNPGSLNGKQVECCPIGWQIFRHSCYYFSTDYSAWSKAQSKCKISESDLVIINRPEEQGFLTLKVKEYNSKRGTWSNDLWYWIGMTDNEKEGMWKWVDGTPCDCIKNQKGYWFADEPDNWNWGGRVDENCCAMRPDGKWSDGHCSWERHWICEKPASACSL